MDYDLVTDNKIYILDIKYCNVAEKANKISDVFH